MEAVVIPMSDHLDVVGPVLADVRSRWRDYVEQDDLYQEALLWWYGKGQKYLAEYLEDENHVRLRRSLWRFVARYAQAEKAAKVGYLPLDQCRYAPAEVVALLPAALDPEGTPEFGGQSEGPKAHGNLAEGGDILAALVDVRRAVEALAEDDVHFLQLVDDLRGDHDRAGELLGIQSDSVRRRYQRVIERMCRWLNNEEHYA
jgi:DNA-directed RNA polymerase specialized sigma24 family protein